MKSLNYLIKPASGLCNMRCKYCFYTDEMNRRACASYGIMTVDTAVALIQRTFEEKPDEVSFLFQGGEPTMAGIGYYRLFTEKVREYNKERVPVSYSIQTNGYAIDKEWAELFLKERFLVGVSLDGYAELHDFYRVGSSGERTHKRITKNIELLKRYGVEFNILTVVTAQTARHAEKVYRYFLKQGYSYQQYIACIDPMEEERGSQKYSLTPKLYGQFLKSVFDLWYEDAKMGRQTYNRYFENLLGIILGHVPEACGMLGHCTRQLVIEADGRVYPCDFYVLDEYCIGDIQKDSFAQIEENRSRLGFIEASLKEDAGCRECQWRMLCRGGCRRDRDNGKELGSNYFCEAYQEFFPYAYPRLKIMAYAVLAARQQ